ncbi:hypothetical protein, partial [Treponema sp.]|uniref:hypothetical protein n=1 Tax=Treponema sp. TaxID=166 RepID=UPI0025E72D9A
IEKYSDKAWFSFKGIYDNTKAWYEQYGSYRGYDEGGKAYLAKHDYIKFCGTIYDNIIWNDDYTSCSNTEGDATVTFTVKDNKDGTVTLKKDDESVTLTFEGYSVK